MTPLHSSCSFSVFAAFALIDSIISAVSFVSWPRGNLAQRAENQMVWLPGHLSGLSPLKGCLRWYGAHHPWAKHEDRRGHHCLQSPRLISWPKDLGKWWWSYYSPWLRGSRKPLQVALANTRWSHQSNELRILVSKSSQRKLISLLYIFPPVTHHQAYQKPKSIFKFIQFAPSSLLPPSPITTISYMNDCNNHLSGHLI